MKTWRQHLALTALTLAALTMTGACRTAGGVRDGAQDDIPIDYFSGEPTGLPPELNDFHHADGRDIVDGDGNTFMIRGVAFGNEVWNNPSAPPDTHHDETDYERVASMGFNSVRFYLNYRIFEEDTSPYRYKERGFAWIDRNLVWAKKHGIRLILNMHVPQGGYQSQSEGDDLWNVPSNRKRLVALWTEIARRYADEPFILAYDLVNEPVVTESIDQWRDLAAAITWSIRRVDRKHIVIVERMNANEGADGNGWNTNQNGEMNFFPLNDRNVVYEFHSYVPMAMTHQNAGWIPSMIGLASTWPDEARLEVPGGTTWAWSTFENPEIPAGSSDWTYFRGVPVTVTDPERKIGRPALQGNGIGRGTVWYDDLTLTEQDAEGNVVGTWTWDMNENGSFSYWSSPERGRGAWSADEGRGGSGCWIISGSGNDAVLSDGSNGVRLTPGHSYTMSGWMKGKNVPRGASARVRLDFHTAEGEVYAWNRDYLEAEIDRYMTFGEKYDVPLYLGEFGCIAGGFTDGRGGLQWVEEMIAICSDRRLGYTYHTWKGAWFGIRRIDLERPGSPVTENEPLIDLFTRTQKR